MRWLALAPALAGCAAGTAAVPDAGALDVQPAMYAITMTLTPVNEGDTIDLVEPPQGGEVLFVGAQVRGLAETTVELTGRLLDLTSGATIAANARTVAMVASPSDPTISIPDLRIYTNVSNITVCPMQSPVAFDGLTATLEVEVQELSSQRTGSGRRTVTLACRQSDPTAKALCSCQCAANYVIGMCAK
jgi:hypothetical protein